MGVFTKLHDIAREGTSFVGKDVLNLAQFLINICSLGLHRKIFILVIHVNIPAHEYALPEFYNL